jgi:hypothetical protein
MRTVSAAAFLLLFLQCPARARAGQSIVTSASPAVETSASPVFEFHSGFWVNLHHFLYLQGRLERARAQGGAGEARIAAPYDSPASVEGMTAEERRAWQGAVRIYADSWSSRDLLLSNQMVLINDRLAELEDCPDLAGRSAVECTSGIVPELVTALDEAAPIYRQRWWPEQDRMNRAWIAALVPPVRSMGEEMAERLADIYQSRWPARIHVDVVGFAGFEGAYTSVAPVHLMISSQDNRNAGMAGFEALFYEASHAIAGGIEYTIGQECRRLEKPIPRNLWNALLLFTASEVMRRNWPAAASAAAGSAAGSSPATGLVNRGWADYVPLLEEDWQAYLNGRVDMDAAILHIVRSI